jgi:hypothetical protein
MLLELSVAVIMIGPNRRLLDRSVHPFDLPVGPGVIGFGEAVIDVVASTGGFKGMGPEDLTSLPAQLDVRGGRSGIAGRSEVSAVIREDGVNLIGNGLDQFLQEISGLAPGGLLDQRSESELGSAVDCHEKVEFSFLGPDLGQINMEIADGIDMELLSSRDGRIEVRQAALSRGAGSSGEERSG